jgi:hypothetical protein
LYTASSPSQESNRNQRYAGWRSRLAIHTSILAYKSLVDTYINDCWPDDWCLFAGSVRRLGATTRCGIISSTLKTHLFHLGWVPIEQQEHLGGGSPYKNWILTNVTTPKARRICLKKMKPSLEPPSHIVSNVYFDAATITWLTLEQLLQQGCIVDHGIHYTTRVFDERDRFLLHNVVWTHKSCASSSGSCGSRWTCAQDGGQHYSYYWKLATTSHLAFLWLQLLSSCHKGWTMHLITPHIATPTLA